MHLINCPACARHHRADERACPFCGHPATIGRRNRAGAALIGVGLTVLGCSPAAALYGGPPPPEEERSAQPPPGAPAAVSGAPLPIPTATASASTTPTASADTAAVKLPVKPPVQALYGAPPPPRQQRD